MESADVNDDGSIDLTDVISILSYLYQSGSAPLDPGPPGISAPCGILPPGSDTDLGCKSYTNC